VVLISYLLINLFQSGSVLPVSGTFKSGFSLKENTFFLLSSFIPITQAYTDLSAWSEGSMRALQSALPIIVATVWVLNWANKRKGRKWTDYISENYLDSILAMFCLYIFAKGIYNFLIRPFHSNRLDFALRLSSFLLIILLANSFINTKILNSYNLFSYSFWENRREIENNVKQAIGDSGIIEYDDGIISYSLNIPTIEGFGFVLDHEAFQAKQKGNLLEIGYHRGYRVIGVVNSYYLRPLNPQDLQQDQLQQILHNLPYMGNENLEKWKFTLIYVDPKTKAQFIRFEPSQ
jgi:hypothetical protein